MTYPIDSSPLRLYARQIGSGPTVICLHSSGSSSAQWKSLTAHLAGGLRVIAPDLLGHGRSPMAASAPSILAQDAAQVASIAAASAGAHLVGHSYGAAVALRVALAHPSLVHSLALYEPVVFGSLRAHDEHASLWREVTQTGRTIVMHVRMRRLLAAAKRFVDYWSGPGSWLAMASARQSAIALRMPAVAEHFEAIFGWPPPAALRDLQIPVLLMHGERTRRATREIATLMAQQLPQVTQSRLYDAGHMGPVTHASAFNAAVVRFLDSEVAAAPALALAA